MKPKRYLQVRECPTPQKPPHDTEKDARYWAKRRVNESIAEGKVCPPLYFYECRCGALHLTKRPSWDGVPHELAYEVAVALQEWAIGMGG